MKEEEIRPRELFDAFLAATREDAERLFGEHSSFTAIPCPACEETRTSGGFEKLGFSYRECLGCGSLYVSPRPSAAALRRFYTESKASEFLAREFYRRTEESRRERIFRPRAALIAQLAKTHGLTGVLADVGAGYGTFLEEARNLSPFAVFIAIEPGEELAAVCEGKGLQVIPSVVEDANGVDADLCTCFEVLEHVHDPLAFLRAMRAVVRPGGLLLFTTLTISGFDLEELWDRSKSITPPHHINFLSTAGIETLIARAGLELVELTTPGELDVDIVANALAEDPSLPVSRFARRVVALDEPGRRAFQEFLRNNGMSSHVRAIARRPA